MKKKIIIASLMGVSILGLMGYGGEEVRTGSQKEQVKQQEKIFEESNRQTGMPNIKNFFEKKTAKKVWELRDDPDLTTYAYTQNMDGKFIYLGKCIGYGLPYTTQYTNPQKLVDVEGNGGDFKDTPMPQEDPNGLYSSETTNATWLILVNEETGEQEVVYSEPSIVVTQSPIPKRLVAEWSLPSNYGGK